MKLTVGMMVLLIHIFCCILAGAGIYTGILKIKSYMMIFIIAVPVWGILCALLIHFQILSKGTDVRTAGVEKLRVNEEIYKNIFRMREENDRDVVPLEEALLINEPKKRRELIMNVLNDDPSQYVELLKQARMNEDVEVVHYAITAMVELSKEYDRRLQNLERLYAASPDDFRILSEYCDFLQEYLEQEFMESQMEQMQRNQYTQLLKKKLERRLELHTCVCLMENLMKQKDYVSAGETLALMDENWHRSEEYWIWKIRFLAEQKMGKELKQSIKQIKEEHIYLSSKGKEVLALWLEA